MEPPAAFAVPPIQKDDAMRKAIFCLLLAFGAAFAAVTGVPEGLEGLAQLAFFSLLVIFVVLMINHLVEDR